MIVFDLVCRTGGHRFEGWFASSAEFARQAEGGLVACPQCGASAIEKAPMAPTVGRKGNQHRAVPSSDPAPVPLASGAVPAPTAELLVALATLQAQALKDSRWVGSDFADQSRAMHYGEREVEAIHGKATLEEARELVEEGIAVLPLPLPVAPPDELN